MSQYSTENRHFIRAAASQAVIVRLPQPKTVDVYERESSALCQNGLSQETVRHRVTSRMGLIVTDESDDNRLVFQIKHSKLYSALAVFFLGGLSTSYALVPLATDTEST